MNGPKVETVPAFKVGEKVTVKGSKDSFEIIAITPEKKLRLRGCAGLIDPSGLERVAPPSP